MNFDKVTLPNWVYLLLKGIFHPKPRDIKVTMAPVPDQPRPYGPKRILAFHAEKIA
jgi:hypothetical protein